VFVRPIFLAINNGSEHGNASDMKINFGEDQEVADRSNRGVCASISTDYGDSIELFEQIAATGIINGNVGLIGRTSCGTFSSRKGRSLSRRLLRS